MRNAPIDRVVAVGPGDDAGVLVDGTAITVDTLIEGTHWNERLSPEDVGYKSVAVSVSDLAAIGAQPEWLVLALSLPARIDRGWTLAFAQGLGEAARRWNVSLLGGDTTRSPGPRMVSVTMGGHLVASAVRRSGARAGDDLWVTGELGLAGAGYALADPPPEALAALRRPDPPLDLALDLAREGLVTAAMDLSDGLASDLPRLCRASNVGATVLPKVIPRPSFARANDRLDLAVAAGEDYELLFSARASMRERITALAASRRRRATRIGVIEDGTAVRLDDIGWPPPFFTHFHGDGD